MKAPRETFECPNCGADVYVGAKVCRECGSDASTGWRSSEEIDYQSIDIPDGYGPDDDCGDAASGAFGSLGGSYTRYAALILAALLVAWALRLL
jgi:hypothetical protein